MNILHEMSVLVGEIFIGLATFDCFDQRSTQKCKAKAKRLPEGVVRQVGVPKIKSRTTF